LFKATRLAANSGAGIFINGTGTVAHSGATNSIFKLPREELLRERVDRFWMHLTPHQQLYSFPVPMATITLLAIFALSNGLGRSSGKWELD
jgi:hypothetical protein